MSYGAILPTSVLKMNQSLFLINSNRFNLGRGVYRLRKKPWTSGLGTAAGLVFSGLVCTLVLEWHSNLTPVVMFVVSQLSPCPMCRLLPGAVPKGRAWQKPVEGIPRAVQDRSLLAPGRRWSVQGLQDPLCGDCLCPCSTGYCDAQFVPLPPPPFLLQYLHL